MLSSEEAYKLAADVIGSALFVDIFDTSWAREKLTGIEEIDMPDEEEETC